MKGAAGERYDSHANGFAITKTAISTPFVGGGLILAYSDADFGWN